MKRYINYLIFDLDNTIYPRESGLMPAVASRISLYIQETMGVDQATSDQIRKDYFNKYGTTLMGLIREGGADPISFANYAYDVNYKNHISYDQDLVNLMKSIPLKKIIYTNAAGIHASNVLEILGIEKYIDQIVALEDMMYISKPDPQSYREMLRLTGCNASESVFFDDQERNLSIASKFGIHTVLVGAETGKADHCILSIKDLDINHNFFRSLLK